MNWKQVGKNVIGTAAAGTGLATIVAGVDWVTAIGIVFACVANLVGLIQKPPQRPKDQKLSW